jgi:hypothetical protein
MRGHDQIAFVLAVLVVEDHDHAAGADVFEDFGDGVESHKKISVKFVIAASYGGESFSLREKVAAAG